MALLRKHWFFLGLGAVVALAALAPDLGRSGGWLGIGALKSWLVAAIFLISGLGLPTRALLAGLGRWRVQSAIMAVVFVAAPLLAWASAPLLSAAGLPDGLVRGWIMLGCLPTTIASCVAVTRAAGGDEAAALCATTLGNLAGIAATPLLLLLLTGRAAGADAGQVATQLVAMVVAPILLGQLLRPLRLGGLGTVAEMAARWRSWFGVASNLLLLAIILGVFSDGVYRGLGVSGAQLAAALVPILALHLALLGIAAGVGRLRWIGATARERIAITICGSQKSAALGVPMLSVLYPHDTQLPLLVAPLLLYHMLQLVVAAALAEPMRNRIEAEAAG